MLEFVSALLVSIGSGAAVIFGLSSWLGKVWASRILENEKKEHQKEIEEYKANLSSQIDRIKMINEKALYISKVQYDKEFSIYQEIWVALSNCILSTQKLYPVFENVPLQEEAINEFNDRKYNTFVENFNLYSNTIDKYAPFYSEDFYAGFIEIRNLCKRTGDIFRIYTYDIKYSQTYAMARDTEMSSDEGKEVYSTIPKELEEREQAMQKVIRTYLKNLQVV